MPSSSFAQGPAEPLVGRSLKSKTSKSSLREAAAAPLSRLRNKLFAVKATQNELGTEVDVVEISHASSSSDEFVLSSPPQRTTSLKLIFKRRDLASPFAHKERPDEYRRQALQSASLKRSDTLSVTPYTPTFPTPTTPPAKTPFPSFPNTSEKDHGALAMTKAADDFEWSSPRFLLAVDPDWDPAIGEATLFIFPQDANDLQGGADCVTLEEIWSGFFPGSEKFLV